MWITFHGASDDSIHVGGFDGKYSEVSTDGGPYIGKFVITADGKYMHVHAIHDGTWAFAVTSGESGNGLPAWAIMHSFGGDAVDSTTLTIDVPDSAEIEWRGM
jgi:hypothetical protein